MQRHREHSSTARARRRWLVAAAAVVATFVALVGHAQSASERTTFIVVGTDAPLATYTGGVAGLAATSPEVTGARKLDPSSRASTAYLAYLNARQDSLLASMSTVLGRSPAVSFRYQAALNGFAVDLSEREADAVRSLPGVENVSADTPRRLQTDNGPAWIGAPGVWSGGATGGLPGTKGEGVVVGVIDTGINTNHPSFADVGGDGYNHTNPRAPQFYGICAPVTGLPVCNDKLIGVYDFTPVGTGEDENGHGSHTASTTAGNVLDASLVAPTITVNRPISGVAPHANVISYKACVGLTAPAGECLLSALVAAINQATLDMVDVVNFSIGGGPSDPWTDADSQAFLNARAAGVFVAASAGNDGPGAGSVGSPANSPWLMSVGASTHDRKLINALENLSGGSTTPPADIPGKSLTSGAGPAPIVDAKSLGFPLCGAGALGADGATPATNPFLPNQLAGKIVLCERGTYGRVAKGQVAKDAGAVGMVLMNDEANGGSLVGDAHVLPAVHISYASGLTLRAWLGSGSGHMGTIRGTTLDVSPAHGDSMASFSSRGPNAAPDVIKPDVTAPGVDILAAFSDQAGPAPQYGVISGTSMSSPHAAGAATLIRALHPSWTPDEVRSALMTTAFTSLPGGGSEVHRVFKEDGVTPADPFDMGGGRIELRRAGNTGLVLDESPSDYANANPLTGGDPKTLNLPSLANHNCQPSCTWTREVKSVASESTTWDTSATAPVGAAVSVSPASITLAPGETAEITVTVDTSSMAVALWQFGDVTLTPRTTAVATTRMPLAVRAQPANVNPPCVLAESVRTDPAEANVAPPHDIREVGTSGMYPTFAGHPIPNLVFRMKVATLDPLPTTSHWRIAFQTPGQPATVSWFVQMLRGADSNAEPTFVYGTIDSAASEFTVLGNADAGSWTPDGTIRITLASSKIGNPQAGQTLSAITGAAGPGVPGTATLNSDSTSNGAGPTTHTLEADCPEGENTPPVAADDSATVGTAGAVNIPVLANDSDADGDALTITAFSQGAAGTVADVGGGVLRYTHTSMGQPIDSFTYTVSDGRGGSDTATVTIEPVRLALHFHGNAGPDGADHDSGHPDEGLCTGDGKVDLLACSGPYLLQSDELSPSPAASWKGTLAEWALDGNDAGGDRTVADPSWIWCLREDDPGNADEIDCPATEQPARGETTIQGPVSVEWWAECHPLCSLGTDWQIRLFADGNEIAEIPQFDGGAAVLAEPTKFTATLNVPTPRTANHHFSLLIEPVFAFDQSVEFSIYYDGQGPCRAGSSAGSPCDSVVHLPVVGLRKQNEIPAAADDSASIQQGGTTTVAVLANDNDADGDPLTLEDVRTPAHGTATENTNGTITYTHNGDGAVSDSFTYEASDGNDSDTATVTISINQPPAAADDTASIQKGGEVVIDVVDNDEDANRDSLSVVNAGPAGHGTVTNNGSGTVTYRHDDGGATADSFAYTVSDNKGGTGTATVRIAINQPPVAADDSGAAQKGGSAVVDVLDNDTDANAGDTLSVTGLSTPTHGTVTDNGDGTVTYLHGGDGATSDSFTYAVSDGMGGTDTATVAIRINQPPAAMDDTATAQRGSSVTVDVIDNDTDANGDSLTVTGVGPAAHGSVVTNGDGTVTYQHNGNTATSDSFVYTVSDGEGGADMATVRITITGGPPTEATATKTTGGGWLADRDGGKINFGFNATEKAAGLQGHLQLNDGGHGAKVDLTKVTALGTVGPSCGSIPNTPTSVEFRGTGTFNGSPASFRVCVQDNGEGAQAVGADRFYLTCTAGCSYSTGNRAADDLIDGGNVQVHKPAKSTTASSQGETRAFAAGSRGSEGGTRAYAASSQGSSGGSVSTLILDPLLLTQGTVGQLQVLTVRAYGSDQALLPGAAVTLRRAGADGLVETLTAVTDLTGSATFRVVNLSGTTEYIARAGEVQSNAVAVRAIG